VPVPVPVNDMLWHFRPSARLPHDLHGWYAHCERSTLNVGCSSSETDLVKRKVGKRPEIDVSDV